MSLLERTFHSILFEALLMLLSVVGLRFFTSHSSGLLFGTMIMLSLMAVVWNFVFNAGFDRIFTAPRETRGVGLRIFHTLAFEGGLLLFTLPVIVYMLNIDWRTAFVMDLGMTLFVVVYTFFFNLIYDHVRAAILRRKQR